MEPPGSVEDRIEPLPEHVVNKIAAGEVVTRPAGVVKELLENSLDAGATTISISVRQGGAKSLTIRDNGRGIRKDDFELLCQRFATSKIESYEDLKRCSTFGFRGEALAAVSQVSRLSVTSRRRGSPLAHKAVFSEGVMVTHVPGEELPKPCAGVEGTVITVDDLFYNIPLRAKSLRSASEEYKLILEVVTRYSVKNAGVAITCRKIPDSGTPGAAPPDVKTTQGASVMDNIRATFGKGVADELLPVALDLKEHAISVTGFVSNPNFNMRRSIAVFFINGRLVDCQPLKKGLDLVFAPLLPKGCHPFMYLDVHMKPENVDVNVHPSKKEVRFLYSEELIQALGENVSNSLKSAQTSRVFYAQAVLKQTASDYPTLSHGRGGGLGNISTKESDGDPDDHGETVAAPVDKTTGAAAKRQRTSVHPSRPIPAQRRVRTDSREQVGALDDFVKRVPTAVRRSATKGDAGPSATVSPGDDRVTKRRRPRTSSGPTLTSVLELRNESEAERDEELSGMLKGSTFVGVVDEKYCLMQFRTKLLLVDLPEVVGEALYQEVLWGFGELDRMAVCPPAPLGPALHAYFESSSALRGAEREQAVSDVCHTLVDHAELLREYFALDVQAPSGDPRSAEVASLPNVVDGFFPDLRLLPPFAVAVSRVCWDEEKPCLASIARQLGEFYGGWGGPSRPAAAPAPGEEAAEARRRRSAAMQQRAGEVRRSLLGPVRAVRAPAALRSAVREIASLEKLYRVFERC